jgi:hypothetical protein
MPARLMAAHARRLLAGGAEPVMPPKAGCCAEGGSGAASHAIRVR